MDINDVCIVSKYEPRMQNLDKLSLTPKTTCPNFQPSLIARENLIEQFGSMSPISIETGEQAKTPPCHQHGPRLSNRQMLDVPFNVTDIFIEFLNYLVCSFMMMNLSAL